MSELAKYRALTEVLIESQEIAYRECKDERKQLHDIEWEAYETTSSVLGEVEIRIDNILGIVSSFMTKEVANCYDKEHILQTLNSNSIYLSNTIVCFIIEKGYAFHKFVNYIFMIENLRMSVIGFINKICDEL